MPNWGFSRAQSERSGVAAVVAVAAFAYFVVLADLAWRADGTAIYVANLGISAAIVLYYVYTAPSKADRLDRGILGALLVFAVPCIFATHPRQSFDSLLGTLLYAAGFFTLRGVLADGAARRLFVSAATGLSAVLTLVVSSQLIGFYIEWWWRTGWTVMPPLDLRIRPEPWVLHYELVLLLVILYPAWWIGRASTARAVAGVLVGILVLASCFVVGSRAIWFAVAAATLVIGLPVLLRRWSSGRGKFMSGAVAAVLLGSLIAAPGMWATLGERFARTASIAERVSVWGPALSEWTTRPLVGMGPGSFPWVLQRTDYFDTHSFAPRHPDSSMVQLVVEAGMLGVLAAAIVIFFLIRAIVRSESRAALFAATAWLAAGLALNVAESEFLVAATVGWVAYAAPRPKRTKERTDVWQARSRLALFLVLPVVIAAFVAVSAASIAYLAGRDAVARGDLGKASQAFKIAHTLDPAMAVYSRQAGTARLLEGFPEEASRILKTTVLTNPYDDLAWRVLGLAYRESGNSQQADAALRRAVAIQRSDPTNLLLLIRSHRAEGNESSAIELMSEVVQAWPTIVAARGWMSYAYPITRHQIAELAYSRWNHRLPSPEPLVSQPLLLGAMLDSHGWENDLTAAPRTAALRNAYVAVMSCDQKGKYILSRTTAAERRLAVYWELRIRQAELDRETTIVFERLYSLMTHSSVLSDAATLSAVLNPLNEDASREGSADTWGYKRWPVHWPDSRWDVPSPAGGFARWHHFPRYALGC